MLYHYWPTLDVGVASPLIVATKGYLGVEAFFTLSGFILCHVYLSGFGEGRFPLRRLPVEPPGAGLSAASGHPGGHGLHGDRRRPGRASSVDPNILSWEARCRPICCCLQAWGLAPVAAWNHASWSISAEWFAYLTFPAFAFAAWRCAQRPLVAVASALALIAALYPAFQALAGYPLTEATIRWGALRIVPCFAYGCALHALWRSGRVPGSLSGPGAILAAVAVVAATR